MNKARRKRINEVASKIESFLTDIKSEIEDIQADEEYAYDSMPENLQGSMRGMDSEEAIDLLDEAIEKIEEAVDSLNSII